ncbi:MAG: response regulator [Elusimicrobia bacterium]|nr:response regulator [Elusimicrobiota bacterium]
MTEPIRVLLVEDEPECGLMMEAFLRSASRTAFEYALDRAETLKAGLNLLARKRYDVVLLDLGLPDSRGLDTLRHAKARAPGVPIVVLTGLRDEGLGRKAIAEGAQDFLPKGDFDSEALRRVVCFTVERSRLLDQFEHVLECCPDGIVVVGKDGVARYANPSAAVLFNAPLQEMVGKPFGHAVGPDKPSEVRLAAEGGRERVVELAAARIEWKKESSWLVSVRDVTALKMVERVRASLDERTRQEDARERFLRSVAHELRSPITIMAALVERFRELLVEQGRPRDRLLEVGRFAVMRLLRFVDSLLALWQMEAGKVMVCRRLLDLSRIAELCVEGTRLAHPGKEVRVEVQPGLPAVFADEDLVVRVVQNLLDNATRFAAGSVAVALRSEGDGTVELSVSDDGPGITEARLGGIFDRFVQADRLPDEHGYKGTGLGLALCKEIVDLHHGRLWVESEPGQGATFRVSLPCGRRAASV